MSGPYILTIMEMCTPQIRAAAYLIAQLGIKKKKQQKQPAPLPQLFYYLTRSCPAFPKGSMHACICQESSHNNTKEAAPL